MSFLRPVSDLRPGDHACLVYDSPRRRDEQLLTFLDGGLARGERLIYIDDGSGGGVADRLSRRAAPDQLAVVGAEETYLRSGQFDPDHVLTQFRATVDSSLALGFSAVRSAGGPPAVVTRNGFSDRLPRYERRAGDLFATGTLTSICTYDVRQTAPAALLGVLDAHPIVVFAVGLDERLQVEGSSPTQLALRGWLDITTLGSLIGPLADAIASGDDVEIDLHEVDFVDLGGWRLFAEAAAALRERARTLRVRAAPSWTPSVLRILGYDEREGLVVL